MRTLFLFSLLVIPAAAGEYAVLQNGFRLRADRHEIQGSDVVLYSNAGETRLPAGQVVAFEPEDYVPPAPASPASSPAAAPTAAAVPSPAASARQLIDRAVERRNLPHQVAHLARSVAEVESGLRQDAVSPKGALGVMQLMPRTAAALQADPRNAEQNVDAGVRYLRDLLLKYQSYGDEQVARALAAYNAGSGAVDKYNGVPPYPETQRYVQKVIQKYQKAQQADGTEPQADGTEPRADGTEPRP